MAGKKIRNKRHLLLKICLPLSGLFTVGIFFASLSVLWSSFLFVHPNQDATAIKTLTSVVIAFVPISFGYFLIFWHRDDKTYLRSAILVGLAAAVVALTVVGLDVGKASSRIPLDVEVALRIRPDLTADDLRSGYEQWLHVTSQGFRAMFVLAVLDSIIRIVAVAFWLWLLPQRWRLPNRYEPVIHAKNRQVVAGDTSGSYIELFDRSEAQPGSLDAISRAHEKHWRRLREERTLDETQPSSNDVKSMPAHRRQSISREGPQFEHVVRYWESQKKQMSRSFVSLLVFVVTVFIAVYETTIYSITRSYNLECSWHCHSGMMYAWILGSWAIAIALLIWKRVSLDHNLFWNCKIYIFLWTAYITSSLLGFAVGVGRLPNNFGNEAPESIQRDSPQYTAWSAVDGMLLISFPPFVPAGMLFLWMIDR